MGTARSLQDMYQRPGFLLKRCHQVSMAIFLDECREFGITQSQYGCLRGLREYPGIDQLALGRLVGLDRSTAGLVIKTLSDRGLIERVVNRADKRRMRLKLSPAGEHLLTEIAPAAARAQERVLRALPRESRTAFLDMLEAFLAGHQALIDADVAVAGERILARIGSQAADDALHAWGGRRQVRRRERSQVDPAKPATLMARSKRVEGSGTGLASVMTRIQSPGSVTLAVSAIWFPKRR